MTETELINKIKNKEFIVSKVLPINILAVRYNSGKFTNKFDDIFYWYGWDKTGEFWYKKAKCTTKSGKHYANNPLNKEGTAIIAEGQYIDSHILGKHKDEYTALVQSSKNPIDVYRDANKNDNIDKTNKKMSVGQGINIHRASKNIESIQVDKWSAACIVFANPVVYAGFINDVLKLKQTVFSLNLIEND